MKRANQRHVRAGLGVVLAAIVVTAVSAALGPPGTAGASSRTSKHDVAATANRKATSTPLAGAVPGPLTVEHDQFVDADGRVVFLHGLFGVWKIPGGLPPDNSDLDGFTPADANLVASLGFDGFRLAWFWSDLEPVQGKYNIAYLSRYKALARELERRGLFVLADSHQDMYSSVFGGDGFPTWASPGSDTDPDPAKFPLGYFTSPVETAFDDFWANVDSVQNDYDAAWQKVASTFVGDPMLAGYDLLNEPFPGSTVSSCLGPQGCRKVDATSIEPAESAAAEAIRSVDTGHIAFYEPNILFNWGQPTGLKSPPAAAGTVGFSFHDQCEERAAWEASGGTIQPTPAQEATCLQQSEAPLRQAHSTATKLGASRVHPRGCRRAHDLLDVRTELDQWGTRVDGPGKEGCAGQNIPGGGSRYSPVVQFRCPQRPLRDALSIGRWTRSDGHLRAHCRPLPKRLPGDGDRRWCRHLGARCAGPCHHRAEWGGGKRFGRPDRHRGDGGKFAAQLQLTPQSVELILRARDLGSRGTRSGTTASGGVGTRL
jgi:hypothetical protein